MKKHNLLKLLSIAAVSSSFLLSFEQDVYGSTLTPDDILSMSIEDMLSVTITTAGKKEEKVSEVPASIVVISREEIGRYGYTELREILQHVPGMYLIDDNVYRSSFGVRGSWTGYPRNVLVMVNGVAQKDGIFGYSLLSYLSIPVTAIDRIEVVRGPLAVIYGHGSFFGAINIITDGPLGDETYHGVTSVSYGSLDSKEVAFRGDIRKDDFTLSLNASSFDTDGPDEPYTRMTPNPSVYPGINSDDVTTDGQLARDSKNLNFSSKYKDLYFKGVLAKSEIGSYAFLPPVSQGTRYERDYTMLTTGYKYRYSDLLTLDGRVNYQQYDFKLNFDIIQPVSATGDHTRGETEMYEVELDAYVTFSEKLSMTSGLFFQQVDVSFWGEVSSLGVDGSVQRYTDPVNNWGVYSQVDYSPLDNLKLVAGLRYDRAGSKEHESINDSGGPREIPGQFHIDSDSEVIPRLAAIYSIDEQNILKFLYGKAISRPSFFQDHDNVYNGFESPDVEEIETYELNYNTIIGKKVNVSASIFHNRLKNLMVRDVDVVVGRHLSYFSNAGDLITNGCELTITAEPTAHLATELSLTYQDTEDQRSGYEDIEPSHSPQWLGYAKASYAFDNGIILATTGRYVGEMEAAWDDIQNKRIGEKSDDYFLLDANLRINDIGGKDGLYFNLRISNLFDKEYQYPTSSTNPWQTLGSMGEGRMIMATVGYTF